MRRSLLRGAFHEDEKSAMSLNQDSQFWYLGKAPSWTGSLESLKNHSLLTDSRFALLVSAFCCIRVLFVKRDQ